MARIKKAQKGTTTSDSSSYYTRRMLSEMNMADRSTGKLKEIFNEKWKRSAADLERQSKKGKSGYDSSGFPIKKKKTGGTMKAKGGKQMIKRADGSYSQRGLWDNLRKKAAENKRTGAKPKAPTAQMLKQERKIKEQSKKK